MNVNPNDYPERDAKTWSELLSTEFIVRVRKENPDSTSLLQDWTDGSAPFNEPARTGDATPEEATRIERLAKMIDSYQVPDNVRMYRVESPEMLVAYRKKGVKFRKGEIVTLEGFTSASVTREAVEEIRKQFEKDGYHMNVDIILFIPKGTKAIPLSQASRLDKQTGRPKYEYQQEWLFQKDTEVQVVEKHIRKGKVFLQLLILNR